MERNADKQTDVTKDTSKGMVTKQWHPCTDNFAPEAPISIKSRLNDLKELFCKPFKRDVPPT